MRGKRYPSARRNGVQTKANGSNWRLSDPLAYHENILSFRVQRFRSLRWIQGANDS